MRFGILLCVFAAVTLATTNCKKAPALPAPAAAMPLQSGLRTYHLRVNGKTTPVKGAIITLDAIKTLPRPRQGRYFLESDYLPDAPRLVVLSFDLWTERFDSGLSLLGMNIDLDDEPAMIIAIAPAGCPMPDGARLLLPKRR